MAVITAAWPGEEQGDARVFIASDDRSVEFEVVGRGQPPLWRARGDPRDADEVEEVMSEKVPRFVVEVDDDSPAVLPEGTVLDGQVAEDYARAAVDAVRARNLVPGRKSLSGGAKHSPVVQTRVPEELHERLTSVARQRGVSVSKLAREALERYLAS